LARGTRHDEITRQRAIIYSPSKQRQIFLESELEHASLLLTVARSVPSLVGALCDDPPPIPQILVIDLEMLSAVELIELHAIRHRGWCGMILALGHVPAELRRSLGVDRVFDVPLSSDTLRAAVTGIPFDAKTTRIPVY
jgi:hypothetical protein